MVMIPIDGKDGYFRDTHSGAVINKNANDFNTYMMNHKKLSGDQKKINSIENEINEIKGDLGDIKIMLKHFMDKHK